MATQKGRNWSSGDIVTAANLSSIERGVSEVAEEYTPTTWANGNTVTAAGLNNIEQGLVNAGGGGSSDFSTATVTIVSNVGGIVYLPAKIDEGGEGGLLCYGLTEAGDYNIVLYKGLCVGSVSADEQNTVTTTGDIENDSGNLLVTGDGTITISDSSGGGIS